MSIERSQVYDVFALTDHSEIAAIALDESLFQDEDCLTIEELIDREAQLKIADESVLQQLLHTLIPDETSPTGQDEHKDAFLAGALLALLVADVLADQKLGSCIPYRELWLSKGSTFFATMQDDEEPFDVYEAVSLADKHDIDLAYSEAVDVVGAILMPNKENIELLQAGFTHTLVNAQSCIAEVIIDCAEKEAIITNDDIEIFLKTHDLTGSLQEVYQAYLEHSRVFGFDVLSMGGAEASKLLEHTISDYERLVPVMSKVEIEGPSLFTLLQNEELRDPEEDIEPYLLEEGCRIVGTVESFTLSAAPVNMDYTHTDQFGDFATTFMPAFVFRDAVITMPDGEIADMTSGEQSLHVGIAVPGTKYRALN